MAGKRALKKNTGKGVLKFFHRFLVAISVIIIVAYGASRLLIKPPPVVKVPEKEIEVIIPDPVNPESTPAVTTMQVQRREGVYNILLVGSDDGNGNTDTIILCSFDEKSKTVGMLSIPRDTLTENSRRGGSQRINAAYATGGMELLVSEVEDILGVPVDHTCMVDIRGLMKIVDQLGGVDFYIPVNMWYHDPVQNLSIEFEKGWKTLNSTDAIKILRFRKNDDGTGYSDSDIGRTRTQQEFLKAVLKKIISWNSVTKIKTLTETFEQHVDTSLTASEIIYLGTQMLGIDMTTGVNSGTLPGNGEVRYDGASWLYTPYAEESLALVNQLVNPYDHPLTLEDMNIFDPAGVNSK